MRLYHVSENPMIDKFEPIKPYRADMDQSTGLVWALCERTLTNFLFPRDCPRVTYHVGPQTLETDKLEFFSSKDISHCVAIEHRWVDKLIKTQLTIYEFDSKNFILQDEQAGYYVSNNTEIPINKYTVYDIFQALREKNVEVRILPELFTLKDRIIHTSFYWSMCRMKNAR